MIEFLLIGALVALAALICFDDELRAALARMLGDDDEGEG